MQENKIVYEDLSDILSRLPDADAFAGKTVLITGATGLVGSMLTKALCFLEKEKKMGLRVLALIRSEEKARTVFGDLPEEGALLFVKGDMLALPEIDLPVDYIFHTASVTASRTFVTQPVETLLTAFDGTKNVLELARKKKTESVVYVSSMEAYGITPPEKSVIREEDLGYIDVLSVRSSYSEGKRACECLCASYCSEYGVPVKIARLAQTFGAGVSREDNRAFAQFAKSALRNEDIILHTTGNSYGNYCYTSDAVTALLLLLIKGENGRAYTVANENTTMKIKDVAALVGKTLSDGRTKVVFDIPDSALTYGYAPDVTMHLSAQRLRALGWTPRYDLPEMFRRLAQSWQEDERDRQ